MTATLLPSSRSIASLSVHVDVSGGQRPKCVGAPTRRRKIGCR